MMTCGATGQRRAMTLIELIVVMGLLATVLALSAPVLSRFAGGRKLYDEARRMLALTRYGQQEAVSRGIPTELWVAAAAHVYGLRPQAGYEWAESKKPVEFSVDEDLTMEINSQNLDKDGVGAILFWPDGTIAEASLTEVTLTENRSGASLRIALADSALEYVIEETMSNE